ncbi:ATP-dependent zinc metalloprotease FtsH [soil metagenome]
MQNPGDNRGGRPPGQQPNGGNNRNPNNKPGSTPPPPKRTRIPSWVVVVLLVGIAGWYVYNYFIPSDDGNRVTISYSAMQNEIAAGNVSDVSITESKVTGELKSSVLYDTETDQVITGNQAGDKTETVKEFSAVVPPPLRTENQALIDSLNAQGVVITGDTESGSLWTSLLISFLPFMLFLGLIIFMGRQMSRGQQNVFGFGRSRARTHDPERPQVTFADVAGEDEAKRELTEVVDFLRNPAKYHQLGARLPRGVLLVGPPGTGKTLTARAVAGEAGVPFFSISASEFVEMFVGVGASRVRDLFEKAKTNSPAIIFIDELDAVGRQRFAGLGGSNDEREQTLNQLLVEMDGFDTNQEVIVMAATNRPDVLDPALLRPGRFDRQVMVGLPDRKGREAILNIHTRGIPIAKSVDIGVVARSTTGFSGAELANLVNEAALTAARRNQKEILMPDFEDALDKILLGTTRGGLMGVQERRVVAYHEAGHAIVAHLTPDADPVRKVTIVPRGRALGVMIQMPEEDQYNLSRTYLRGRISIALGGRASEMVVFDEITTGAESDLKQATSMARRMVGTWGMSDEIGPIYLGTGEEHVFLGREITQEKSFSDATAQRLDKAIREIIETQLDEALSLIRANRPGLERLVAALLEKETLDTSEVIEILGPPIRSESGTVISEAEAEALMEPVLEPSTPAPVEPTPTTNLN